jgi:hypothetical protein
MGHRVRHGAAANLPRSSIGGFSMDHETIGGIHRLKTRFSWGFGGPIITIGTFSGFRHCNLHIYPLDPSFGLLTATSFVVFVELQTNAQFVAEYQMNVLPGYAKTSQNMFYSCPHVCS